MQYELKSLMSKISERNEEMNTKIEYYQSSVSDSISKKLSEMDKKYGLMKEESSNN